MADLAPYFISVADGKLYSFGVIMDLALVPSRAAACRTRSKWPMERSIATPEHLQLMIEPAANAGRYNRLLPAGRAA